MGKAEELVFPLWAHTQPSTGPVWGRVRACWLPGGRQLHGRLGMGVLAAALTALGCQSPPPQAHPWPVGCSSLAAWRKGSEALYQGLAAYVHRGGKYPPRDFGSQGQTLSIPPCLGTPRAIRLSVRVWTTEIGRGVCPESPLKGAHPYKGLMIVWVLCHDPLDTHSWVNMDEDPIVPTCLPPPCLSPPLQGST